MRSFNRNWGEEFVPAIHYKFAGTSLCGTTRAKINGTKYTKERSEVTCKNCIKKLIKDKFAGEHFEKELFTL